MLETPETKTAEMAIPFTTGGSGDAPTPIPSLGSEKFDMYLVESTRRGGQGGQ